MAQAKYEGHQKPCVFCGDPGDAVWYGVPLHSRPEGSEVWICGKCARGHDDAAASSCDWSHVGAWLADAIASTTEESYTEPGRALELIAEMKAALERIEHGMLCALMVGEYGRGFKNAWTATDKFGGGRRSIFPAYHDLPERRETRWTDLIGGTPETAHRRDS